MRQLESRALKRGYLLYTFVLVVCGHFSRIRSRTRMRLNIRMRMSGRIRLLVIVACVIIDHDRIRFLESYLEL